MHNNECIICILFSFKYSKHVNTVTLIASSFDGKRDNDDDDDNDDYHNGDIHGQQEL